MMSCSDAPKILLIHNRYQDRAGEDLSFDGDRRSLSDNGIEFSEYIRDNREIEETGPLGRVRVAAATTWSFRSRSHVRSLLHEERPDIVHFHNTFPLISPSPYWACREAGVPVVQTVRNFRVFCGPGVFFRDGRICEDCLSKRITWPGVVHGCYRSSRARSAAVSAMQTVHGSLHTWSKLVDTFIVPSVFVRAKLIQGGVPADLINVRPDVVDVGDREEVRREAWGLFVGRLTAEKGIATLLRTAREIDDLSLKVVGTGPLEGSIRDLLSRDGLTKRIQVLGGQSFESTISLMRRARFLVVPSEWYETFGRVAVEAFACGTPVIAARLGALEEVVEHGSTGLQFSAGDPEDLAIKIRWALANPDEMTEMGDRGRAEYERRYSARSTFAMLMDIYAQTMADRGD